MSVVPPCLSTSRQHHAYMSIYADDIALWCRRPPCETLGERECLQAALTAIDACLHGLAVGCCYLNANSAWGHCGIAGNDEADELATAAHQLPPRDLPLALKEVRAVIHDHLRLQHPDARIAGEDADQGGEAMHGSDEEPAGTAAEKSHKKTKKHRHKGLHQAPLSPKQQHPRHGQSGTSSPAGVVSPPSANEGAAGTAGAGSSELSPSTPPLALPAEIVVPTKSLNRVDEAVVDGGQPAPADNMGRDAVNQAIETKSVGSGADPGTSAKKKHGKKRRREAKEQPMAKAVEPRDEKLSRDQEPTAQSGEEPTKTTPPDPSVPAADERQIERAPLPEETAPKEAQPADEPPPPPRASDKTAVKEDLQHGALKPGEVTIPPDRRSIRAVDEHDEERDQRCGLLGVYPRFLQKYRTPRCALTALCLVSFTRSFSMNGVMMVVLPSLERRYQMKSYESGMILSSNDVASCLAMLPVAFLATQRHKPRFVGSGIAIMGLGNMVVAMVHFLSPPYSLAGAGSDTCPEMGANDSCTESGSIRDLCAQKRHMAYEGSL
ncbi:uncharacterized protein LOC144129842 [Amblyomma americanum]